MYIRTFLGQGVSPEILTPMTLKLVKSKHQFSFFSLKIQLNMPILEYDMAESKIIVWALVFVTML